MKRIGLFAVVLLIAGATLALNVIGIPSLSGSCTINGTCTQNCTCPDKGNCNENCTCWNNSCAKSGCNYQNCTCPNNASCALSCSELQNDSEILSCPLNATSGLEGCGTGETSCPINIKGQA